MIGPAQHRADDTETLVLGLSCNNISDEDCSMINTNKIFSEKKNIFAASSIAHLLTEAGAM